MIYVLPGTYMYKCLKVKFHFFGCQEQLLKCGLYIYIYMWHYRTCTFKAFSLPETIHSTDTVNCLWYLHVFGILVSNFLEVRRIKEIIIPDQPNKLNPWRIWYHTVKKIHWYIAMVYQINNRNVTQCIVMVFGMLWRKMIHKNTHSIIIIIQSENLV